MKTIPLSTLHHLTALVAATILTACGLTGCVSKLEPTPAQGYDLDDASFSQQPGIGSNTNNEVKS